MKACFNNREDAKKSLIENIKGMLEFFQGKKVVPVEELTELRDKYNKKYHKLFGKPLNDRKYQKKTYYKSVISAIDTAIELGDILGYKYTIFIDDRLLYEPQVEWFLDKQIERERQYNRIVEGIGHGVKSVTYSKCKTQEELIEEIGKSNEQELN